MDERQVLQLHILNKNTSFPTCALDSPRGFFLNKGVLVDRVRPLVPSLCLCSNEGAGGSRSRSRSLWSRVEALGGGDSPTNNIK